MCNTAIFEWNVGLAVQFSLLLLQLFCGYIFCSDFACTQTQCVLYANVILYRWMRGIDGMRVCERALAKTDIHKRYMCALCGYKTIARVPARMNVVR